MLQCDFELVNGISSDADRACTGALYHRCMTKPPSKRGPGRGGKTPGKAGGTRGEGAPQGRAGAKKTASKLPGWLPDAGLMRAFGNSGASKPVGRAEAKPELVARQVFVTTGATRGDQVAILKGVSEGDTVIYRDAWIEFREPRFSEETQKPAATSTSPTSTSPTSTAPTTTVTTTTVTVTPSSREDS